MMGLGEELLGTIRKLAIASEWAITMSKGGFPIIDNLERNPPVPSWRTTCWTSLTPAERSLFSTPRFLPGVQEPNASRPDLDHLQEPSHGHHGILFTDQIRHGRRFRVALYGWQVRRHTQDQEGRMNMACRRMGSTEPRKFLILTEEERT